MKKITPFLFLIYSFSVNAQTTSYKTYHDCSFSVQLPESFQNKEIDDSPDFCSYEASNGNVKLIEFNSMNMSRFETTDVAELFQNAISNSTLKITYKIQKDNWFVISGIEEETGNIVYWKRVVGENFISDLYNEYEPSQKTLIEPYIGTISMSFKSD